jgi:3-isopropylmalate dehydratase small subunit
METHNRLMLLNGVDEIADTLQFEEDIREYERRRSPWLPVTHG